MNQYQKAEQVVWQKLSDWRKQQILEARTTGVSSHFLEDFAKEIIKLAESADFEAEFQTSQKTTTK
jgi:hypothetical protein